MSLHYSKNIKLLLPRFSPRTDYVISLASNVLSKTQTLIIPPLVIISAGHEAYGTYVLLMAMTLQILAFNHFGLGFNFRRNLPSIDSFRNIRELFFPQFYLKFFLIIIGSVLTGVLVRFYLQSLNLDPRLSILVPICLIITFLNSNLLDYLRYSRRTGWMSMIQSFSALLFLSIILITYFLGQHLSAYKIILIETIVLVIPIFVICIILLREIGFGKRFYTKKEFKSDIDLGLPEYGRNMFDTMSSTVDRFLVAGMIGTASLSIYQPSMAIITIVLLVPITISLVSFPNLAMHLDENRINDVTNLVHESKISILYFVVPWSLFCVFIGEEVFRIWLQGSVQIIGRDKFIFIFGSIGVIFASLFQFNLIVITGYKLTLRALKISMISFLIGTFVTGICLYSFREIFWASLGYCLFQITAFLLTEQCIKENLRQKKIYNDLFRVLISSMLSIFSIYNLYFYLNSLNEFQDLFSLIISCLFGAGLYIGTCKLLGVRIVLTRMKS